MRRISYAMESSEECKEEMHLRMRRLSCGKKLKPMNLGGFGIAEKNRDD